MALPNILTISFRPQHLHHPVLNHLAAVTQGTATLTVLPVADMHHALPSPRELLAPYDAVFILGSSRLFFDGTCGGPCDETRAVRDALYPVVRDILERDIPTFAFCFGHQLLAHCAGGSVAACTRTAKVGTFPVHITSTGLTDPLLKDFPATFSAHYAHHDVIDALPDTATILATSDTCDHALVRYGSRVYSSQFHPELDAHTARTLVAESPVYQQSYIHTRDFVDTPEREQLLTTFIRHT